MNTLAELVKLAQVTARNRRQVTTTPVTPAKPKRQPLTTAEQRKRRDSTRSKRAQAARRSA